jgi:hypothetical protein
MGAWPETYCLESKTDDEHADQEREKGGKHQIINRHGEARGEHANEMQIDLAAVCSRCQPQANKRRLPVRVFLSARSSH